MTPIEALGIGIAATLLGIGCFFGIKKALQVAEDLTKALKAIPDLATANRQLCSRIIEMTQVARQFKAELEYLRSVANGAIPPEVQAQIQQQAAQQQQTTRRPVPFPSAVYDRFTVVPDAEVGDTDRVSLEQTDEDLAEMEKIEALRAQGMIIEDEEVVHEGVQVEAE